jgi:predicted nucleotidyltransferase
MRSGVCFGEVIAMPPVLHAHKSEIDLACRRFGVEKLELFGSAAAGTFLESASDLDFLVTFNAEARKKAFDNYFGLLESLEGIFGRSVDLVTAASVRNPYLAREIEQQRQLVYAA